MKSLRAFSATLQKTSLSPIEKKCEILRAGQVFNQLMFSQPIANVIDFEKRLGTFVTHENQVEPVLKANIVLAHFPHLSIPKSDQLKALSDTNNIKIPENENGSLRTYFEINTALKLIESHSQISNFSFHSENTTKETITLDKPASQKFCDGHITLKNFDDTVTEITIGTDIKHGNILKFGAMGHLNEVAYIPEKKIFYGVLNDYLNPENLIQKRIQFLEHFKEYEYLTQHDQKKVLYYKEKLLLILKNHNLDYVESNLMFNTLILELHQSVPQLKVNINLILMQNYLFKKYTSQEERNASVIPENAFENAENRKKLITYIAKTEDPSILDNIRKTRGTVWEPSHIDAISEEIF